MEKPTKCTTPKRNRHSYRMTSKDLRNLTNLVTEANKILAYYSLMPENKTGELEYYDNELYDNLYEAAEDLLNTLGDINLL